MIPSLPRLFLVVLFGDFFDHSSNAARPMSELLEAPHTARPMSFQSFQSSMLSAFGISPESFGNAALVAGDLNTEGVPKFARGSLGYGFGRSSDAALRLASFLVLYELIA